MTLTSADNVVLYDSDFNPQVDRQAIDRVHRIGQTRDVTVVRLAIPETVEDQIIALQERKRSVALATLGDPLRDGDGAETRRRTAAARLDDRDFRQLFGAI